MEPTFCLVLDPLVGCLSGLRFSEESEDVREAIALQDWLSDDKDFEMVGWLSDISIAILKQGKRYENINLWSTT